jgi:hypothetical protein
LRRPPTSRSSIWARRQLDDTYYYKLLDGGLPVFRTFGNCVTAVKAYMDYWAFVRRAVAVPRRLRSPRRPPREEGAGRRCAGPRCRMRRSRC